MVALHRPPLDEVDLGLTHAAVRQRLFGDAPRPTTVGRFEVESTVGFGGMGRVYIATDPDLRRRVALKLIRAEDDAQGAAILRERLVAEAQALAQLSHPNVIVAYEVGIAGDDVFLAMEYAAGADLRRWIRTPRPWAEVVSVFIQAARGLAAAHRAGLVHRDFKPDNVLVGDDGRVRVLDFGLALASHAALETTEGSVHAGTHEGTPTGSRGPAGTPGYLAPELSDGAPADARSDQYAYCVSLFEALFGHRPGVHPQQATRNVPAWLTAVVQRGLSADPELRHPSMEALGAALERDPTAGRRRVMLFGLIAAVGVGVFGWGRVQQQRAEAACEASAAAAADRWNAPRRVAVAAAFAATSVSLADVAYEGAGHRLDRYVEQWHDARLQACEAPKDPQLEGLAVECLQRRLAELDGVVALLEAADADVVLAAVRIASELSPPGGCLDADALRRASVGGRSPSLQESAEIEAMLARAALFHAAGRVADARGVAEQAQQRADALGWPPMTVRARHQLGVALMGVGELQAGRSALVTAFGDAQAIGRDDLAIDAAVALVNVDNQLARYDEAKLWGDLGRSLLQRIDEPHSARAALLLDNLGNVHASNGDLVAAHDSHARALAMRRAVLGDEHPHVAGSLIGLGSVAMRSGRFDDALEHYAQAQAALARIVGEEHPLTLNVIDNTASVHYQQGHLDEARVAYERVLEARGRVLGPQHPSIATTRHNLGSVFFRQGDLEAAEQQYRLVLEAEQGNVGNEHPAIADVLMNLAGIAFERGRPGDALAPLQQAIAIRERIVGADDPELVGMLSNLASVHVALDRDDSARSTLERALAIAGSRMEAADLRREPAYVGYAELAERAGDVATALAYYGRALVLVEAAGQTERAEQIRERLATLSSAPAQPKSEP